ncbi:unnamed protein product [Sphenostylis stenocarpa]|uniref:Uncharacterized protein n=1 Tax=Sphenostylis stenocarpa TaxID=92480 RepID=A0AA86W2L2_9FABA|nr:unnamed protein product [Sphenostylis stenocarpa]
MVLLGSSTASPHRGLSGRAITCWMFSQEENERIETMKAKNWSFPAMIGDELCQLGSEKCWSEQPKLSSSQIIDPEECEE